MKNICLLGAILLGLLASSCKERDFPTTQVSTDGKRVVVAEELTGVRCPNCPDGTVELTKLDSLYGEKLIVVSIHSAFPYYFPYAENKDTFFFPGAESIRDYIGTYNGFPAASINRKFYPAYTYDFIDNSSVWGGLIASDGAVDPKVNMYMENDYDEDTRNLTIKTIMEPEKDLESNLHLTVLITEDSIIDYQNEHGVIKPDYVHRHVLRAYVTPFDGTPITESLAAGSSVENNFSFQLPAKWEAKHCAIVAFLHRSQPTDKEILQAIEHHVVE